MPITIDKSFPGVEDPFLRSVLSMLAEHLETAINWQTDGSLVIEQAKGASFAYIPGPFDFRAFILNGTQPYSWVRAEVDQDGVCHAMNLLEGKTYGNIDGYTIATVILGFISGTSVTITLDGSYVVTGTIFIAGINPPLANGIFSNYSVGADSSGNTTITYTVVNPPGPWVDGGAVSIPSSATAYNQAWEFNGRSNVPTNTLVWMRPKYLRPGSKAQDFDFYCYEPFTTADTSGDGVAEGWPVAVPQLPADATGEALAEGWLVADATASFPRSADATGEALAEGWWRDPLQLSSDCTGSAGAEIWFAIAYGGGNSLCNVCDIVPAVNEAACCCFPVPGDSNYDVRVSAYVLVESGSAYNFCVLVTWTDEDSNVWNYILQYNTAAGVDGIVIVNTDGQPMVYPFETIQICAKAGTAIFIRTSVPVATTLCVDGGGLDCVGGGGVGPGEPNAVASVHATFTTVQYNLRSIITLCRVSA